MSNYNAYVYAHASKSNSACAILINGPNGQIHKRVLAFKNTTNNKAELQAIKYVVLAIDDQSPTIEISTTNTYILSMLDKDKNGDWARTPTRNAEQIRELRDLVGSNTGIKVVFGAGDTMEKAKWMAKAVFRLPNGLPKGAKSPADM